MPQRPAKKHVKREVEIELSEEAKENTGEAVLTLSQPLIGNAKTINMGAIAKGEFDAGTMLEIVKACANELNNVDVLDKLPFGDLMSCFEEAVVFFEPSPVKVKRSWE